MLMEYIEYNICKGRKEIRLIQDTCIRFSITVIEIKLITNVQLVRFQRNVSKHNARETTCLSSKHQSNNMYVMLYHVSYLITYSAFNDSLHTNDKWFFLRKLYRVIY